ncbi:MAG: hypothetical protein JWR16_3571 [Nevskia sp.]|nr:hypothetical protein [Nevskia sp.]
MRKQDSIRRASVGTTIGAWSFCASLVVGLVACGGSKNDCHYMSLANGLIGQTTYAGNAVNQGLAPSAATLAAPLGGLVTNASATVGYVVDTGNNRILGYTLPQPVGTAAASFVLGQADFTGVSAGTGAHSGSPFGLASPSKVSVSDDGKLVVTDTGNNRVLIWNIAPTSQAGNVAPDVIIGQPNINSTQPNQGATKPTASTLSNPTGAMLANSRLVVVDQNNNRVLIWDTTNAHFATGSAANVELGQVSDGSSSINSGIYPPTDPGFTTSINGNGFFNSTTGTVAFTGPADLWTEGRTLVVSDTGNNRVLFWSQLPVASNVTATAVIGQTQFSTTNPGVSNVLLNHPVGVFSASGGLFVADTSNNRVLNFGTNYLANNKGATAIAVYGQQDFTHSSYNDDDQNGQPGNQENNQSNTNATQNTLQGASSVFVSGGNIYVGDRGNNRIVEFPINPLIDGSNTDGNGINNCNGYNPISPN